MTEGRHRIGEEIWIEVAEVARCYRITVGEIETWIRDDLIRRSRIHRGVLVVATVELDTVATLIRLVRVVGLDPVAIRALRDAGDLPGLG